MQRAGRAAFVLVAVAAELFLALSVITGQPQSAQATAQPTWGWPLAGTPVVDRGFEPPMTKWGPGHRGVDLRGELNDPVLSAGAGRVSYAGLLAGRGVVVVAHDEGLRTTYEPVEAVLAVGAQVQRGTVLGTLTAGHASCRAGTLCLHWGLLRGNTYLDPLSLILHGSIRLLPMGAATGTAGFGGGSSAPQPEPVIAPRAAPAAAGGTPSGTVTGTGNVISVAAVTAAGAVLCQGRRRSRSSTSSKG